MKGKDIKGERGRDRTDDRGGKNFSTYTMGTVEPRVGKGWGKIGEGEFCFIALGGIDAPGHPLCVKSFMFFELQIVISVIIALWSNQWRGQTRCVRCVCTPCHEKNIFFHCGVPIIYELQSECLQ